MGKLRKRVARWGGRLGQFADLRGGGLAKKRGVDTPMHTMDTI